MQSGVQDMFQNNSNQQNLFGIQGYQICRKYENPLNQNERIRNLKKHKVKPTKRGSYLDDYKNVHKAIPGPGQYNYAEDTWNSKGTSHKSKIADKKTFIDEIICKQKKEKMPAPGQYEIRKSQKKEEEQKIIMKKKMVKPSDRFTFLDGVQFYANDTPGVGHYNTRPHSAQLAKSRLKPQDWRKMHHEADEKLEQTRNLQKKKYQKSIKEKSSKIQTKKSIWNTAIRFKTIHGNKNIGPGKYVKINEWNKDNIYPRSSIKSIYYN